MNKARLSVLLCGLALVGLTAPASAGLILQPASATTKMGTLGGSPTATINKSGLSIGYTNGVTDFDTYIASDPRHGGPTSVHWTSAAVTGNFDFNLGGTFLIESFALWNNGNTSNANVKGFELYADDNSAFSSPALLGTYIANNNLGSGVLSVAAEVFGFAPTSASFVRMKITSNYGHSSFVRFGEAIFEVHTVPEPSSIALFGTAIAGLGLAVWRRDRQRMA